MTVTGVTTTTTSTFNLQTIQEVKEIFRSGVVTTTFVFTGTYDSTHTDFTGSGTGVYNGTFVVTSYTKVVEGTTTIMGVVYTHVIQEYTQSPTAGTIAVQGSSSNTGTFTSTRKPAETTITVTFSTTGIVTFMQWNNFIVIFITTETQSYTLYTTTAFFRTPKSTKAGTYYFTIGSVGSITVTTGFVTIYAETGTTNTSDTFALYSADVTSITGQFWVAYATITLGTFTKIGAAPTHNWTISIYGNTPPVITTWISISGKVAITTVIYTTTANTPFSVTGPIATTIAAVAAVSIIFGATGGTGQTTTVRTIAYSGTVNSGYFTTITTANNASTTSTFTFNIVQYGTTHVTWFATITISGTYYSHARSFGRTVVADRAPKHSAYAAAEFIRDTYGSITANPYTGFCYIIVTASTIGIPPTTGFYAKFYMLITAMQSSYTFTATTVTTSSAITAYYYVSVIGTTIATDTNDYSRVIAAWRNHAKQSRIGVSPTTATTVSICTVTITTAGVVGTDIANNGTHMVESYHVWRHV
uniref:NADH dehydrogenase subunit 2 n=1 Tax=Magnusiomyces fungicola TaxID=1734004 RepID=UPI001BF01901|nr:NADH dehydrogenase subunit 2 [Saprochaete fungicola]QUV75100.1 NADH dehydrogenase subunit 2 [Saprochaete fungicola]